MINEANASSSACRLWRISQVETGAPPTRQNIISQATVGVKCVNATDSLLYPDPVITGIARKNRCVAQDVGGRGGGDVRADDGIETGR